MACTLCRLCCTYKLSRQESFVLRLTPSVVMTSVSGASSDGSADRFFLQLLHELVRYRKDRVAACALPADLVSFAV